MWEHASAIAIICGFVLTAASTLVLVTWRLSSVVAELKECIQQSRDEVEASQEKVVHNFGETILALRQKVHEIETWARDEFVRKNSFDTVISRIERMITEEFGKIDRRMERFENKMMDGHK